MTLSEFNLIWFQVALSQTIKKVMGMLGLILFVLTIYAVAKFGWMSLRAKEDIQRRGREVREMLPAVDSTSLAIFSDLSLGFRLQYPSEFEFEEGYDIIRFSHENGAELRIIVDRTFERGVSLRQIIEKLDPAQERIFEDSGNNYIFYAYSKEPSMCFGNCGSPLPLVRHQGLIGREEDTVVLVKCEDRCPKNYADIFEKVFNSLELFDESNFSYPIDQQSKEILFGPQSNTSAVIPQYWNEVDRTEIYSEFRTGIFNGDKIFFQRNTRICDMKLLDCLLQENPDLIQEVEYYTHANMSEFSTPQTEGILIKRNVENSEYQGHQYLLGFVRNKETNQSVTLYMGEFGISSGNSGNGTYYFSIFQEVAKSIQFLSQNN